MPHVFFVAVYETNHWEESMRAQHALTQRFWAADDSVHVRRLVSEGTRPRLPWARRLPAFQADPVPVLTLLELLKDDPELYVRRSVANNLNDIAKDNPDLAITTCARWMEDASPQRRWLVRHALRSVVKDGRPDALAVLGFGSGAGFRVSDISISPPAPRIGDAIRIAFRVDNLAADSAAAMIDLRIHFVKANGSTSAKVFRIATRTLAAGEHATVGKTISLAQHSTRTHYPGQHRADAIINGATYPLGAFTLEGRTVDPPASPTRAS